MMSLPKPCFCRPWLQAARPGHTNTAPFFHKQVQEVCSVANPERCKRLSHRMAVGLW